MTEYERGYNDAKKKFDRERVELIREIHDKVQKQSYDRGVKETLEKLAEIKVISIWEKCMIGAEHGKNTE